MSNLCLSSQQDLGKHHTHTCQWYMQNCHFWFLNHDHRIRSKFCGYNKCFLLTNVTTKIHSHLRHACGLAENFSGCQSLLDHTSGHFCTALWEVLALPPRIPQVSQIQIRNSITRGLAERSAGGLDDHITNESLFWTKAAQAVLGDTTLNHAALAKHQIGLHAEAFTKDWATLPAKRRKQTQGLGR